MKKKIYQTIDSSSTAERYEVARKLREEFPDMVAFIDSAMEVYIDEDIFSKDENMRSLAYIEKLKKQNSQNNLAFIESLFSRRVISLTNTKSGGGWVVFVKNNRVISSQFDKNLNFTRKFSIETNKYKRLTNPVKNLYGDSVINNEEVSKKIITALKSKVSKESSELTFQ
ncbi:hypothetical protein [Vibrio metschnikovii]|uniref:Uncharacterized protein n=1 Tax=Vibrio metschnikovii TaxID=28172 RepID=A0A9X0UJ11_VIBME|nr:hypothetical protein [Vibrio metschnikovii]MBC5851466.1 hypothetical protein [Vibrio metschnikovii]